MREKQTMRDKKHKAKVLIIGLDGATWDLIKPWAEEGKLPTFKKLMEGGVYGNLKSTIPPWTIPAWNCMLTGKNPGKLGVFTFMCRSPDSYVFRPYFLLNKPPKSVLDIISENGKTVCAVNIPMIHYAYKINGCMVAGWLYHPSRPITYPEELKSELDSITGGYEIDVIEVEVLPHEFKEIEIEGKEAFLKYLYRVTEKRVKATEYLLDKYDWDFFMVVFVGPDRIQHRLWEDKDEIEKYYQYIDKIIAKLLDKIGNNVITILVSDHGFGAQSKVFNISEWLIEKGLLKLRSLDKQAKVRRILGKLGLWHFGKRLLPGKLRDHIGAGMHNIKLEEANVDWSKTRVYVSRGGWGDIYINLIGREPEGIVEPGEEYEKLRDWIIKELRKLGVNVFKKEEIYFGNYIDRAPDLIVQVDDTIHGINPSIGYGSIFSKSNGGNHRINGIFLAYGPGIKRGFEIENAEILDITPTILHIMEVPIPDDTDGRVLKEIFEEESELAKKEILYQKTYERERIKEKIKGLKFKRNCYITNSTRNKKLV